MSRRPAAGALGNSLITLGSRPGRDGPNWYKVNRCGQSGQ